MSETNSHNDKPQPFNMPGYGLKCAKCGNTLNSVERTTTTEGFITRKRRCQHCGEVHITSERIIHTRESLPKYNRKLLR